MDVEIRTIAPEEFDAFMGSLEVAFSGRVREDEVESERSVTEFDRCLAALEDGEFIGGAIAASYRVTVPGGSQVRAAAVTSVGVVPTHTRRGVNTALMRRQLDDVRERGEPIALLGASEGGIYGRFGYGVGSFVARLDIETDRADFIRGHRPGGRVRLLDRASALPLMRPVYDAVQATHPGMVVLDDRWWEWRFFVGERDKEEPPFWAVHETDGVPDAYAVYSVKHEWPDSVPRSELSVEELMATTPRAYADMWRYVFDIDLVHRVKARHRPPDEPLLHLLQEPRRLRLTLQDGMWARLVDLPVALASRGYQAEGRVVFEVVDAFCPWNEGRYSLDATVEGVVCEPTSAEAEISCSVNDLGAVFLGGVTFRQLHRAGRIDEGRVGAVSAADALFASDRAPWCSFGF